MFFPAVQSTASVILLLYLPISIGRISVWVGMSIYPDIRELLRVHRFVWILTALNSSDVWIVRNERLMRVYSLQGLFYNIAECLVIGLPLTQCITSFLREYIRVIFIIKSKVATFDRSLWIYRAIFFTFICPQMLIIRVYKFFIKLFH